jgi:two-component system chemotaxis response regulator CheY
MATDLMMQVMVVEDNNTTAQIIRSLLAKIGFRNVDRAENGESALTMMRARKYGLVISDCYMEPMNGLDLLKAIRADEVLRKTPFIIMTAEVKAQTVVEAKKAGVNGYIVKPFTVETLKVKIDDVLTFDPDRRQPA